MKSHLKKQHLVVLLQAYEGDTILSPDVTQFYWRTKQHELTPNQFAELFESGLMTWIDDIDGINLSSEGVITEKGRDLVLNLDLMHAC